MAFPGEQVRVLLSRTSKGNEADKTPKFSNYQERVIVVQSGEKGGLCLGTGAEPFRKQFTRGVVSEVVLADWWVFSLWLWGRASQDDGACWQD